MDGLLDSIPWEVVPQPMVEGELPHVTHKGVLNIGEQQLRCYRLSSGVAVFDADDFKAFFSGLLD